MLMIELEAVEEEEETIKVDDYIKNGAVCITDAPFLYRIIFIVYLIHYLHNLVDIYLL